MLPKDAIPRFIAEARDILKTQLPDGAAGTTSPASQRTGASPACGNSSWRPLRRAQKPASQWHGMVPARDGKRKLPLTVLTACSNDVRVM